MARNIKAGCEFWEQRCNCQRLGRPPFRLRTGPALIRSQPTGESPKIRGNILRDQ
jgi:hypothetical protein